MKKIFFILFVLFSAMTIIRLYGEGSGGGIWNIIQIVFVLFGIITLLFSQDAFGKSNLPVHGLLLYSLFVFFLSIFSVSPTVESFYYFLVAPYSGLLLYLVFHYACKSSFKSLRILSIILFYLLAYVVFTKRTESILVDEIYMGINSYYIVCLLPLALLYHNKLFKIIPFVVTFFVVLITNKRTGFIVIVLMLLYFLLKNTKKKSVIYPLFVSIAVYYAVVELYEKMIATTYSPNFFERLAAVQDDGGSGRDVLWKSLWDSLGDSSVINIIFGHGLGSVSELLGHAAHNDFLQILYEYGVIACVLYVVFYIKLVKQAINMRQSSYPYSIYFELSIISALVFSMFSFFIIEPRYVGCSLIVWGTLLADYKHFEFTGQSKFESRINRCNNATNKVCR